MRIENCKKKRIDSAVKLAGMGLAAAVVGAVADQISPMAITFGLFCGFLGIGLCHRTKWRIGFLNGRLDPTKVIFVVGAALLAVYGELWGDVSHLGNSPWFLVQYGGAAFLSWGIYNLMSQIKG